MITRKLNILFIDDEPDYILPIADFLSQSYEHTVTTVPGIERAQRKILKDSFDVIFLDYKLSGGTGVDVLKWMRKKKIEIPIIMVTGHGREEVAAEAMKLGAYDYLNKADIQLDYLPIVINNAYERFVLRRAQRELEAEKLERERNELAIRVFQDTVRGFIEDMNAEVANILLRLKTYEEPDSHDKASDEQAKLLPHMLDEIRKSSHALEITIRALLELNKTVTHLHDVDKKVVNIRRELDKTLSALTNGHTS